MLDFEECPISGQLMAVGEKGTYWINDSELRYCYGDYAGMNEEVIFIGCPGLLLSEAEIHEMSVNGISPTD